MCKITISNRFLVVMIIIFNEHFPPFLEDWEGILPTEYNTGMMNCNRTVRSISS